jgi:hypothetical protein
LEETWDKDWGGGWEAGEPRPPPRREYQGNSNNMEGRKKRKCRNLLGSVSFHYPFITSHSPPRREIKAI